MARGELCIPWTYGQRSVLPFHSCCFLTLPTLDIHKTNVPDIRMVYRWETLTEERQLVLEGISEDSCFCRKAKKLTIFFTSATSSGIRSR